MHVSPPLLPPSSKALLATPYTDECIDYGVAPVIPLFFYIPKAKLRSLEQLLELLLNDTKTHDIAFVLQSIWKEKKTTVNDQFMFDLVGTRVSTDSHLWTLVVPRKISLWDFFCSQIRIGDRLSTRFLENPLWLHVGFVHDIQKDSRSWSITIHFKDLPKVRQLRFPMIRMFYNVAPIYYMTMALYKSTLHFLNTENVRLLEGPPQSGKTTRMVREIQGIASQQPNARILCLATSEALADEISLFLLRLSDSPSSLLRVVEWDRPLQDVPSALHSICYYNAKFFDIDVHSVSQKKIWITTVWTSRVLDKIYSLPSFTHVFMDNSSRISEPEALIPLTLATVRNARDIQLVGCLQDPEPQIPSLFHRLYDSVPKETLTVNHATVPNLVRIASDFFKKPMGSSVHKKQSGSAIQVHLRTALYAQVHDIFRGIRNQFPTQHITVFCGNSMHATELSYDCPQNFHFTADLVELFDRPIDVLVVSTMQTLSRALRRLDVCFTILTRPRVQLVIVGFLRTLLAHPFWKALVGYAVRNDGLVLSPQTLRTEGCKLLVFDYFDFETEQLLLPENLFCDA